MLRRRRMGRTDLEVSEISLGTAELGMAYGIHATKPTDADAAALLHAALDSGINLLDTARAYGDAESIIGRSLKERRDEYILLSKVSAGPPEAVRDAVDCSLRELHTDRIDIMLIHCGGEAEPDESTAATLDECRSAGKIRFVGASVYGEAAALTAIDSGWCDCVEIAYSALDRRPEERILQRAAERAIGVIARSVLLKGVLTSRAGLLPNSFQPLKDEARRLAAAADTTLEGLPRVAYRYVLGHSGVSSALVGASGIDELHAAISFAEAGRLDSQVVAQIRRLPSLQQEWLHPGKWPSAAAVC